MKRFLIYCSLIIAVASLGETAAITSYVQVNPPIAPQPGGFNTQTGTVGSLTDTGLTPNQCVQAGPGGLLSTTGAQCGSGGGGGSSSLQVTQSGVQITSPTASINFIGPPFSLSAIGSTSTIRLDASSVTLQGNSLLISNMLSQSSATATYLQQTLAANTYLTQSSATATYLQIIPATATYLQLSSATATYLQQSSATATYLQNSSATVTYCHANGAGCTAAATTLTGDVSGSGTGSFATTASAIQANIRTFTSSITITGAGGLTLGNVASGVQCLHANAQGQVTGTASDCGSGSSGGGGAGVIAGTGNLYDTPYVSVASSNTLAMSGNIKIFPSSITILGAVPILSTETLQSSATFYVSSGTVAGQFMSGTIATSGNISGGAIVSSIGDITVGGDININSASILNRNGGSWLGGTSASQNIFMGSGAAGSLSNSAGQGDTLIGASVGQSLSTGISNTYIGKQAGYSSTTGTANTGIGFNACSGVSTNSFNVCIGDEAGTNAKGSLNTYIGEQAGDNSGFASDVVWVGYSNAPSATADGTVAVGAFVFPVLTSGASNVGVGFNAGAGITAESSNTIVGAFSGSGNGNGNITIGYNTNAPGVIDSIAIGNNLSALTSNGAYLGGTKGSSNALTLFVASMSAVSFTGNVNITSGALLSGAAGTNGQVLTSGGANAVPTWTNHLTAFSATQPILYNSGTGAFSATPISLSTGVIGILPAANVVSTTAYTTSTQTYTAQQTFNNTVVVSTTIGLGVAGTVGNAGQVLTSQGASSIPTWTTVSASGSGIVSPGTFTWSNSFGVGVSTIQVSSNTILGAATYYANGVVLGASMNANELSGTLQAGQFPALTGDITTSAGSLATTAAALQSTIGTFSSSITVTNPSGLNVTYGISDGSETVTQNGLGVTLSSGITVVNNTASAAGAQQISPAMEFRSNGWKTNAPASTQTVKWDVYDLPIQGAANPTVELHFLPNVNGTAQMPVDMCGVATGGSAAILNLDAQGCDGTGFGPVNASSEMGLYTNTTERILYTNSGQVFANGQKLGWASGTLGNSFAPDTVISRNGVGTVEFDTSTVLGTYAQIIASTSTFYGPIISSGPAVSVTSCGATPNGSVSGTNTSGVITVGGGVVTSCTLNFSGAGFPSGSTVACVVSDNSTTVNASLGTVTTTSAVFNTSATLGGGLLHYICIGTRI